jgi:hypothetical protein
MPPIFVQMGIESMSGYVFEKMAAIVQDLVEPLNWMDPDYKPYHREYILKIPPELFAKKALFFFIKDVFKSDSGKKKVK